MKLECLTCHGVYDDAHDGVRYFHVCPSLSAAELAAAVAAQRVVLPVDPATGKPETPDVAVLRRSYTRANRRDERPDPAAAAVDGVHPPIAAGAGTTPRPDLDVAAALVTVDLSHLPPAAPAVP